MKARKVGKKRAVKKAGLKAWARPNRQASGIPARKKGDGVIDLFVGTYEALG